MASRQCLREAQWPTNRGEGCHDSTTHQLFKGIARRSFDGDSDSAWHTKDRYCKAEEFVIADSDSALLLKFIPSVYKFWR